jgi:hypothetical protein
MKILLSTFAVAAFVSSSGWGLAQDRGSIPPGTSQDGAAPSEGALKGGAIQPGETGGVPDKPAAKRCEDLEGTLREQCLRDVRPSGGATRPRAPATQPGPVEREPRSEPPPQNPR